MRFTSNQTKSTSIISTMALTSYCTFYEREVVWQQNADHDDESIRGNNPKPTWQYKETEAMWQQHEDQLLNQLQSPKRVAQRLPWDNYDHFLHDSDQRQRLKHVEKHRVQLTPNVEAIAEIFKNSDSPPEAAMSGWKMMILCQCIDYDKKIIMIESNPKMTWRWTWWWKMVMIKRWHHNGTNDSHDWIQLKP